MMLVTVRMGAHIDIAPLHRRMQERLRRAHAQPVLDRALAVGHTFLNRAVVVGVLGYAEADGALP
jgi:hypothetical protein